MSSEADVPVWQSRRLAEFVPDAAPICYGVLKPGVFDPRGVPLIRIVDLVNDCVEGEGLFRIASTLDAVFKRSRLRGGEILLSIQGTIGRVAIVPPELASANISRTIARIDVDGKMEARFLRQWLLSTCGQRALDGAITGTTRDSLNIGALRLIEVPAPSQREQLRIAEILETVEAAIRSTQRLIDKLESFAFSWFSEVAKAGEQGSPDRALSDCGTWLSGGTPSTAVREYWNGDIPWITASSLKTKYLVSSERKLTPAGVRAGSRLVPRGTLIFVVRGMSLKSEFRVGISGRDVAFGQDCKALQPSRELLPEYLYLTMVRKAHEVLALVDEASHGTGRLQTALIGRVRVPSLSLDAQHDLVRRSEAFQHRIDSERSALKKLRFLKRGLMDDLLTGRVRVNVDGEDAV